MKRGQIMKTIFALSIIQGMRGYMHSENENERIIQKSVLVTRLGKRQCCKSEEVWTELKSTSKKLSGKNYISNF